jgi:hypothetical protein
MVGWVHLASETAADSDVRFFRITTADDGHALVNSTEA